MNLDTKIKTGYLLHFSLSAVLFLLANCSKLKPERVVWKNAATFAGINREFGEPFGLAFKDKSLYVSDGEQGKIWRVSKNGDAALLTDKLDTPSGIAFDKERIFARRRRGQLDD